jgi:hypothetical protein
MKFENSRKILEKILEYQIAWKSVHCDSNCFDGTDGRTDRQTDLMQLIALFAVLQRHKKIHRPSG